MPPDYALSPSLSLSLSLCRFLNTAISFFTLPRRGHAILRGFVLSLSRTSVGFFPQPRRDVFKSTRMKEKVKRRSGKHLLPFPQEKG